MSSYQQVTLIGHITEPEMRYTTSGVPVTSFSLAVSRKWQGGDGQQQEKTVWFKVSAWRKLAETASQHLHKGSKVLVVGEIEGARPYTDRNGNAAASLEVTAQTIRFMDSKGANGSADPTDSVSVEDSQSIPF